MTCLNSQEHLFRHICRSDHCLGPTPEPSALCYADEGASGPTESTVVELAGPDKAGKLAQVTRLLTNNGCNVRSAAVRLSATSHTSLATRS